MRLETLFYQKQHLYKHVKLEDPKWDESQDVHDWRNYVGKYTRQIWSSLDREAQAAIALDANDQARLEDWD